METDFDALLNEAELSIQQPFSYTDYFKEARDDALRACLPEFPNDEFESFSLSFAINSTKSAPLVYAILEYIPQAIIDKGSVSIQIGTENEFLSLIKHILALYDVICSWRSTKLRYNGVDFTSPTFFNYLIDHIREKHNDLPWSASRIDYLPKKTRTKRKKSEVCKVRISKEHIAEAVDTVIEKYLELYGKNKDVIIYRLSVHRKVVVIEDSLIIDFRLTPEHMVYHEFGAYLGNPYITIQELTYNELFKFNFAGFRRCFDSQTVAIYFYHFYSLSHSYYLGKDKAFNTINRKLPELKLKQRLREFPGEVHHFIILRMKDSGGGIKHGVAETKGKVHSYILKLCQELETRGSRSLEIYSASCLPIEDNLEFIKAFLSWKGQRKRWRLENKFSYFYEDRPIRDEVDSYFIKKEILRDALLGKFDGCEFGTYTKPLNRWKSEELVYNIVKRLYKDHQVIYQYRPFFLNTEGGAMSYDVYICGLKVAIEYQGRQHFEPVEYFGGSDSFQRQQERDKLKAERSAQNGVKLVYINYWEDITVDLIRSRVEG